MGGQGAGGTPDFAQGGAPRRDQGLRKAWTPSRPRWRADLLGGSRSGRFGKSPGPFWTRSLVAAIAQGVDEERKSPAKRGVGSGNRGDNRRTADTSPPGPVTNRPEAMQGAAMSSGM